MLAPAILVFGTASAQPPDAAWSLLSPQPQYLDILHGTYDPVRNALLVVGRGKNAYDDLWAGSLAGPFEWSRIPVGFPRGGEGLQSRPVTDPSRNRVLVIEPNADETRVRQLGLGPSPAWSMLTQNYFPTWLYGSAVIYDPIRDRLIVQGGTIGDPFGGGILTNGTWTVDLADSSALWALMATTGTPPPPGHPTQAAYDAARDRLVVLMPSAGSIDVWTLPLGGAPQWSHPSVAGTPPQRGGPFVYVDPVADHLVMVGGGLATSSISDVWTLSLAPPMQWTQVTPAGTPPTSSFSAAAYIPGEDRVVGRIGTDDWQLTLAGGGAWTQISSPWPTVYGTAARFLIDPVGQFVVVHDGGDPSTGREPQVWTAPLASPTSWTRLMPSGPAPAPRTNHGAMVDSRRRQLIVFGGRIAGNTLVNDLWMLDLANPTSWVALTPTGTPPLPQAAARLAYDATRDRMLFIGGTGANEFKTLSLGASPEWTSWSPTGVAPTRYGTMIHDPVADVAWYVVTGTSSGVWSLTLGDAPAWNQVTPASAACCDPVLDVYARRIVMAGATSWELDLDAPSAWSPLTTEGQAPWRPGTSVWDADRNRVVHYDERLWALSFAGPVGVPPRRFRPEIGLAAAIPNPGRAPTFTVTLPRASRIQLGIFDVGGRLVRMLADGPAPAGASDWIWDGLDRHGLPASPGVYLCVLDAGGVRRAQRLTLLR